MPKEAEVQNMVELQREAKISSHITVVVSWEACPYLVQRQRCKIAGPACKAAATNAPKFLKISA